MQKRRHWKDYRAGLKEFLRRYNDEFKHVQITPCGGRPIQEFIRGVKSNPNILCLLLMDADKLIGDRLETQYQDEYLPEKVRITSDWVEGGISADDDQFHFMVIKMEAWFYADMESISTFYGKGFLPPKMRRDDVEKIPNGDIVTLLEKAAKMTDKKNYDKGKHGPEILSRIDPHKVAARAPHCARLFETLKQKLQTLDQ
jgi:hypothetical protein